MKVKVQIIGIWEEEIPPPWHGLRGEISLESPATLHYLLTEVLKIRDTDKVVLVNGKYRTPIYDLQDGDEIQIFPRLDGG
jgi:molybdopterin converting factor small subunit